MKPTFLIFIFSISLILTTLLTEEKAQSQNYGKALNLGIGIGYYGYVGRSMPVLHANYEFSVARNFTLAPFVSFYSYRNEYNAGNGRYYFHETVVPIGVKGSFYFDDYVQAGSAWDFYLAGSLGFTIAHSYWDDGYPGDKDAVKNVSPLYLDIHLGTEYHFNEKFGAFLDLSSGMSTIGLSFH